MSNLSKKEINEVLNELKNVRPEQLTGEAKKLFEAIMKIADERDELEYKYNRAIEDLVKLEKERQADKEKIKEYAELLIKVNVQNLNNSIEQRKESNEQLEALHEGWKIELEKKDNRIKKLEADNYECNNIINDYIGTVNIFNTMIKLMLEEIVERKYIFGTIEQAEQYFENKAKESGEIDEDNRTIE